MHQGANLGWDHASRAENIECMYAVTSRAFYGAVMHALPTNELPNGFANVPISQTADGCVAHLQEVHKDLSNVPISQQLCREIAQNVQWREFDTNRLIEFRLEDHNDLEFKYAEEPIGRFRRVRSAVKAESPLPTDVVVENAKHTFLTDACTWCACTLPLESHTKKARHSDAAASASGTITYRFCNVRVRTYLYNFVRFEQATCASCSPRSLRCARPV